MFEEGVDKNFKEYAEGQGAGPGFFDPVEEDEEADSYSKMPAIKDFGDLNKLLSESLFGGKADKIVARMNTFMKDLEDVKMSLE